MYEQPNAARKSTQEEEIAYKVADAIIERDPFNRAQMLNEVANRVVGSIKQEVDRLLMLSDENKAQAERLKSTLDVLVSGK